MQKLSTDRRGAVAIQFAGIALPLTALLGLGLEMSMATARRAELQAAVDAGALAGAIAKSQGETDWAAVAAAAFDANDAASPAGVANFSELPQGVRGEASALMPAAFTGLMGQDPWTVTASAVAGGGGTPGACILVLAPSGTGVLMNSDGQITSESCGMQVNSSANTALFVNSGAEVRTPATRIVGEAYTNSGAVISPAAETGAPAVADPLAALPEPSTSGGCSGYTIDGTVTLSPGIICGYFNVNSGARAILNPGVYVFTTNLAINAAASLEGTGVTIYLAPGAQMLINSNSKVHVSAPTSGTYAGILFFQGRSNANQFIFNTSADLDLKGTIYIPAGETLINSGVTVDPIADHFALITRTMIVNSGSELAVEASNAECAASAYLPAAVKAMCGGGGGAIALLE